MQPDHICPAFEILMRPPSYALTSQSMDDWSGWKLTWRDRERTRRECESEFSIHCLQSCPCRPQGHSQLRPPRMQKGQTANENQLQLLSQAHFRVPQKNLQQIKGKMMTRVGAMQTRHTHRSLCFVRRPTRKTSKKTLTCKRCSNSRRHVRISVLHCRNSSCTYKFDCNVRK